MYLFAAVPVVSKLYSSMFMKISVYFVLRFRRQSLNIAKRQREPIASKSTPRRKEKGRRQRRTICEGFKKIFNSFTDTHGIIQ